MNEEAVSVWVRMDGSCSRLRGMYVSTIGENERREGKGREEMSEWHVAWHSSLVSTYSIDYSI